MCWKRTVAISFSHCPSPTISTTTITCGRITIDLKMTDMSILLFYFGITPCTRQRLLFLNLFCFPTYHHQIDCLRYRCTRNHLHYLHQLHLLSDQVNHCPRSAVHLLIHKLVGYLHQIRTTLQKSERERHLLLARSTDIFLSQRLFS